MSANGSLKIFYVSVCRKRSEDSLPMLQFCCYFFLNLNYWNKLNTLFNFFYTKWKILMHSFEIHFLFKNRTCRNMLNLTLTLCISYSIWHFEILKIQICKAWIVPLRNQISWKLLKKWRFYKQKLFFEKKFEAL